MKLTALKISRAALARANSGPRATGKKVLILVSTRGMASVAARVAKMRAETALNYILLFFGCITEPWVPGIVLMKKVGKSSDLYTYRGSTTRANKWRIQHKIMAGGHRSPL